MAKYCHLLKIKLLLMSPPLRCYDCGIAKNFRFEHIFVKKNSEMKKRVRQTGSFFVNIYFARVLTFFG